MRTSQLGDHVRVHYVKRFPDGAVRSSRARGDAPLDLTVGSAHPRLPGLGAGLVGLAEGTSVTVTVPAEQAYGVADPTRVHRVARTRFDGDQVLAAGRQARMQIRPGRLRIVRVVEVKGRVVVVDTNHPRSGQVLELEVELVSILPEPTEPTHCVQ